MANMTLEKLKEITDILERAAIPTETKPHVKEFVVLEFMVDRELQFGLSMSKCVNLWMSRGYTPLGGPLHIVDTVYLPMVLKT
jgi:hypothetical protein